MVVIQIIEVVDVEEGKEQTFEDQDAITKLKKCLELKPEDPLEVKWKIGESLVHLLMVDYTMPNDVYKQCCNEAIQCFNEVRAVESEYKKGYREPEIAQESLKYLSSLSASKIRLAEEEKLKESEVAKHACKDNPDDAEFVSSLSVRTLLIASLDTFTGNIVTRQLTASMLFDVWIMILAEVLLGLVQLEMA